MQHQSIRARVLTTLVVAASLLGLLVPAAVTGAAAPGGTRFIDPVFEEVTVTSDLVYGTMSHLGEPFDLKLDIYEAVGDTAEARPLMVWIHGGGFQTGDKAGPLELIMANAYAAKGYVVASIGYRLASGNLGTDINNANADGRTAVAWLRENADTFRIDSSRVVAAGMSAGAFVSISLGAQSDIVADPGLLDGPSHVDGVVSLAGAGAAAWPQAGEAPILMLHGVDDEVVPFAAGEAYCAAANAATVPCELLAYEATETVPATHVGFLGNLVDIDDRIRHWLHSNLDLASWSPITFLDVDSVSVFFDDIAWMATTGVTTGFPGPEFRPAEVVTRQTMAAFLRRLNDHLGGPSGPSPDPGFVDVPVSSVFYDDIAWMAANGITAGTGGPEPRYDPTAPVSRQAMAAFLFRLDELLAGNNPPSPDPEFLDVPTTSLFHEEIAWMADTGITTGYTGPTFQPTPVVTRQAMAAFMHRLDNHLAEG